MYLYLPVDMCAWAISNKFISPFQLYVYLKGACSGKMKINNRDELESIAEDLGYKSYKSINNNLTKLKQNNWIGYSKKSGYYFIRGLDEIRKTLNLKYRSAARFNMKDILKFKAFIAAVVIGKLANQQKKKKREKRVTERNMRRSNQITRRSSQYFPVSNIALAKVLNISVSTAFLLKKSAFRADFIDLRKNLTPIAIQLNCLKHYKKVHEDIAHKIIVWKGKAYIQESDTVIPKIYFKRRKKIETYLCGSPTKFRYRKGGVDKGEERPLIDIGNSCILY